MNKTELTNFVAQKANITNALAKDAIEAVLEGIRVSVVEKKESVSLIGFGSFSIKERPEHQGFNPATKEKITVPAKSTVTFKPSKTGWF